MRVVRKTIDLSSKDIEYLKGMFGDYSEHLKGIEDNLARRLAEIGVERAEVYFAETAYDGNNDVSVKVEKRGDGYYAVVASGNATLFLEFGSGLIGYGHPEPMGFGPGTYSDTIGKRQWRNPEGWIYEHHAPRSHGNTPSMAMYRSHKEVEQAIRDVAEEVFDFYT